VSLHRIEIVKKFNAPVDRLFSYLSEHENLATIFAPAKIKRIRNGQDTRNGVGSARRLRILFMPSFVETVTAYKENELIEYRITQGSPLKHHHGVMRFYAANNGSSCLHYSIVFEGKFPLIAALIKPGLEQGIRRGLKKIKL
jgi:uncharacterized protein YndB with AHSA1/START domain